MRLKASWGFWFCLVTGILAIVSAFGRTDTALATRASSRFHQQFMESKFADMHREASTHLQRRISRGEFINRMSALRLRVGDNVTFEKTNHVAESARPAVVKYGPVTIIGEDYFLKAPASRCDEYIDWLIEDGESKLKGYTAFCDSWSYMVRIP